MKLFTKLRRLYYLRIPNNNATLIFEHSPNIRYYQISKNLWKSRDVEMCFKFVRTSLDVVPRCFLWYILPKTLCRQSIFHMLKYVPTPLLLNLLINCSYLFQPYIIPKWTSLESVHTLLNIMSYQDNIHTLLNLISYLTLYSSYITYYGSYITELCSYLI